MNLNYWKSLIDDLTSWDIRYLIWWLWALMSFGYEIWYMMVFVFQWPLNAKYDIWWLCLNDPWLLNMILSLYDSKLNKLEAWYCALLTQMLNLIAEIWWPNIRKVWLMILTLENKIQNMMVSCFNDPWMQNMIYDSFVRGSMILECEIWYMMFCWPLNVKYDIWWLCLNDPLLRNNIWWFCLSMPLEWEIWDMIALYPDDPW
jgi:hypothetical protein